MSAKGGRVDPANGIVALLIKSGLLTVRKSGLVALTVKGREALQRAARTSKKKPDAFKKKPALPPQRMNIPEVATASRRGDTEGATATILRFRRR
jgi:hypothetical protein